MFHLTEAASKTEPSWYFTSLRNVKVTCLPSGESIPLVGQPGDDLAVRVDAHQRVVDLVVRVAIDERARQHRVEVDHVVFEDKGDRAAGRRRLGRLPVQALPGWARLRRAGGRLCRCAGRAGRRLRPTTSTTTRDDEAHRPSAQQARQKITASRHRPLPCFDCRGDAHHHWSRR